MQFIGAPPPSAPGRRIYGGRRTGTRTRARRFRSGYDRTGGSYGRSKRRRTWCPGVPPKNFDSSSVNCPSAPGTTLAVPTGASNVGGAFLVGIPQDTTPTGRIGRRINLKSLEINGLVVMAAGTAVSEDVFEMYMILDTQANGAVPAITDIFSATTACKAIKNLDNSERFRTLKHWQVTVQSASWNGVAGNYSGAVAPFHKHVDLKGIQIEYNSNAGALTEIKANHIFLVAASSNGQSQFQGSYRVRYQDR